MKKLFGFILAILVIYVIYYDLTVGTLPSSHVSIKTNTESAAAKPNTSIPSFEAKVKPGETVMSIVEHHIDKELPVSITELIKDFEKLNPGQSPERIQIGSTYLFPEY